MLEAYLGELERDLRDRLPREDVQTRLAEAEAHLREGIDGRVELGLSREDAVREAIAAFGEARRIAQATPLSKPKVGLRVGLLSLGNALGILFLLFGYRYQELYPASVEALFVAWLLVGVAFAGASFRARRPASVAVSLTGLGGALAMWLVVGTTWLDLSPYGEKGVVPPGQAARMLRDDRRYLAEKSADLAWLDYGRTLARVPGGLAAFGVPGGYVAPDVSRPTTWDRRVAYVRVADEREAIRAWTQGAGNENLRSDVARLRSSLAAIPRAQAGSTYANLLAVAPGILVPNLGVAAAAVGIDLVFGGLGFLAVRVRGRKRGLRA